MFDIFRRWWKRRPKITFIDKTRPIPQSAETVLLEEQLAAAGEEHSKWALKYYLQLKLDGLPEGTAAKLTSFKFFGSYSTK